MAVKSIPNDIFQYSLATAFSAGLKEGGPPVAFLTNHGNHGLGLFDDEESECIQLDGTAHSIAPDGSASPAAPDDQLPFVMVTIFQPRERAQAPPAATTKEIAGLLEVRSGKNTPLPVRVRGRFRYLNTQQRTYWDVRGTVFGFRVPGWQRGVSGGGEREGLYCCFLSEDGKSGGRVLDFETGEGVLVEWAKCGRFHLGFPQDEEFEELRL